LLHYLDKENDNAVAHAKMNLLLLAATALNSPVAADAKQPVKRKVISPIKCNTTPETPVQQLPKRRSAKAIRDKFDAVVEGSSISSPISSQESSPTPNTSSFKALGKISFGS
jgi:hypothetical protein